MTTTTGYSSQRPALIERRTRIPIHTASASSRGGQTQLAAVSPGSSGAASIRPSPVPPQCGGRNPGPPLWLVGQPGREQRQHRPADREPEQRRPRDRGFGGAADHEQEEDDG